MGKHGEKFGKVAKSGEKLEKVVKSGKKWGKVMKNFGCLKITFDHSSCHFRSIRTTTNFFFFKFLDKMAASGHFGLDDNYRLLNEYSVLGPSSLVGI